MSWTDERIDQLKTMWEKGLTASQIAEELGGVSRNAVIGKAHRLGLKSRPSPVKAGEAKPKVAKKAEAPKPAKKPEAEPEAESDTPPFKVDAPAQPVRAAPAPAPAPTPAPRPVEAADPADDEAEDAEAGTETAAPPCPCPPQRGNCRQDHAARPDRPHLPLADGPPGRTRFPLLRPGGQSGLPVLRGALRPGLSGAVAARYAPPSPADAIRRTARALSQRSTATDGDSGG